MTALSKVINRPLKLTLLANGQAYRIDVALIWDALVHVEVQLVVFPGARDEKIWALSRDLLIDGLDGRAGLGDVFIGPYWHDGTIRKITLASPSGVCSLLIKRSCLDSFLTATRGYVLPDADLEVTDEALARLLEVRP